MAEVTKEAVVHLLKSLLMLTPMKCIMEVEALIKVSKGLTQIFAHTVKSRASESELISLVAACRSDI